MNIKSFNDLISQDHEEHIMHRFDSNNSIIGHELREVEYFVKLTQIPNLAYW